MLSFDAGLAWDLRVAADLCRVSIGNGQQSKLNLLCASYTGSRLVVEGVSKRGDRKWMRFGVRGRIGHTLHHIPLAQTLDLVVSPAAASDGACLSGCRALTLCSRT